MSIVVTVGALTTNCEDVNKGLMVRLHHKLPSLEHMPEMSDSTVDCQQHLSVERGVFLFCWR